MGGGGGLIINPFRGRGMDIFWNYILNERKREVDPVVITSILFCEY